MSDGHSKLVHAALNTQQRAYLKFIAIILLFCAAAFVVTIYWYERANHSAARTELAQKLDKLASTYSLLYSEPLASGDIKRVNNYTIALMADPDIVSVRLTDVDGKLLDEFVSNAPAAKLYTRELAIHYAGERDFRTVGAMRVQLGTHRIDAALAARLTGDVILFSVLVVAVLVAVALAFRFSLSSAFNSLSHQASHDQLTELLNRRAFMQVLSNVIRQRRDHDRHAVLLFIDLDNFKIINDTKGHLAGDGALQFAAAIFRNAVRRMDVIGRMGGDEFCVLLPECSREVAERIGQQICSQVAEQTFVWAGDSFRLGVSIGIVLLTDAEQTPQDLIRLADQACYRAKQRGKNCVEFVDPRKPRAALLKSA